MKKTLIASAVAAATLSSTAFAMDPATDLAERLDSMPTIYGNIQLANVTVDDDDDTTEDSSFIDNGSTLGFMHEHEISDGLTGFMKAEFEFVADDKDATGFEATDGNTFKVDEAYIGVKGDFGSVHFGTDEYVYDAVDAVDMFEAVGLSGELGNGPQGDNLTYMSPEIGEGLTLGLTLPLDLAGDDPYNASIAGMLEMDNMSFALGYSTARDDSEDALGLMGSIALDDLSLTLQYETQDENKDYIAFLAQYGMGANNFALGYALNSFDADGLEDESELYLQALHNLSDNMYVYVEYLMETDVDGAEGADVDSLALGAAYAF